MNNLLYLHDRLYLSRKAHKHGYFFLTSFHERLFLFLEVHMSICSCPYKFTGQAICVSRSSYKGFFYVEKFT